MPKLQSHTTTIEQGKGDNTSSLPFMEGTFLIFIGQLMLKLEAYPTPKRPKNWNKDNRENPPIRRHIPLTQDIAEIRHRFPSSIQARKGLADGKMQIRVNLVFRFTKCVHARNAWRRRPTYNLP